MSSIILICLIFVFIAISAVILTLIKNKDRFKDVQPNDIDYKVVDLGPQDSKLISDVMFAAKTTISDELYMPLTSEEVREIFKRGGAAFGIEMRDKVVGILTIDVPNDVFGVSYEDYYAGAEQNNTMYIENCAVLPEFRGNSFQRILVRHAESWLKQTTPKCEYFMCTVAPDNKASHHSMEMLGYSVVATDRMYGNNLRDVMWKKANID